MDKMGYQLNQHQANGGQNQQNMVDSNAVSNGNGSGAWGGPFPSLHLWPIQDTFAMKMIHLPEGQRVKIGRQTNNKTVPGERNAYFDSKVLSRTHAEIWSQDGKIFIKDIKSSNGTFVNNDRLSPEGVESEPYELKTKDIVEFGIDIVSDDNRTIIHHKVAARAFCVFNAEDAAFSARGLAQYETGRMRRMDLPGGMDLNAHQARPVVPSSGGKPNGLSFEVVLNKLQTELQKSKDTGAELNNLSATMNEIQDGLSGGLPPSQNGSAVEYIPAQFRDVSSEAQAALAGPHGPQAAAYISLQNQLGDTQNSLNAHLEKIQRLEGQLKEQESLRSELSSLRDQMDSSRRDMDIYMSRANGHRRSFGDESDDDDDSKSIATIMDHEDSEERVRQRRRGENGGRSREIKTGSSELAEGEEENESTSTAELNSRIQALSVEINEAVQLSRSLQAQHTEAMSAVRVLTQRIGDLESGIASKVSEEVTKAEQRWEVWRAKFEDGWRKERESWDAERERLRGVVREWEEASRRGREEAEERELNESLSGGEFEDDDEDHGEEGEDGEDDDDNDAMGTIGEDWKQDSALDMKPLSPVRSSKASRRRRPSHRTTLAVRALKSLTDDNGNSTPKAERPPLEPLGPPPVSRTNAEKSQGRTRSGKRRGTVKPGGGSLSARSMTSKLDNSSESGRESGDTLKDSSDKSSSSGGTAGNRKLKSRRRDGGGTGVGAGGVLSQNVPVFTVLVVAVVAGALYYKNKD